MNFLDKITAQLPLGKKSDTPEYFFALNIGLSEVTAAVWGIFGHDIDILGQASLHYEDSEDLVDKAHRTIDHALGALEVEPNKILFGVPDGWGIDDNLKEPYLKLLQKMLKEFDLSAIAYVTTTNALSFQLQKQEGAPPTTILLGLGDFIEVTLVKGGKIIGTRVAKRTSQLFADIEGVLRAFTEVEALPSKIQIYSTKEGEDINKAKDDLMSYPWMQKLSFLHFPKIEVLDKNVTVESIILSAALEINPQVNLKHSFTSAGQGEDSPTGGQRQLGQTRPLPAHLRPTETGDDLGFVRGDIKEHLAEKPDFTSPEYPEDTAVLGMSLPKVLGRAKGFFLRLSKGKRPHFKLNGLFRKKLIFAPVVVVIFAIAYLVLVKATVTVLVEPKVLENDAQIVADPKVNQVDEANKIIPGTVVETTVSGSGKASATGTKQIGDPAKGKVTIYNMTSFQVSLSQGTTLVSGNGLKFTLDSSVQIASQSSNYTLGGDMWGKSDPVGVAATVIGPDSNLPASSTGDSNTYLAVGGYSKSQVVALISEALSGGTSKEVKVVTADDQKKLQAKVVDELRQKAEEELRGKETSGRKIISEALTVADGKYNFNKAAGDQASEFSLSATVHFKGTSYSDSDLRTIVSKLVATNVPDGFTMNPQDMETQADVAKVEKDGRLIFKARFKAKLLPKFDTVNLKNQIRGKSVNGAVNLLKGLENVVGAEVKFTPSLPGPLMRIPLLNQNITIDIAPK